MADSRHNCISLYTIVLVGLLLIAQILTLRLAVCTDTPVRRMYIGPYEIMALKAKIQEEESWFTNDSLWTTVVPTKTGSGSVTDTFPQVDARFVKITVTANTVNMAAHIEEIKVYQVTSTSGSQLVQVQPAGVTASSYSYDKAPSLAVDGVEDPSNYWGTSVHIPRGLVPQWLALDLGSTLAISNITTHFYDGDLRTYTYYIQVSNDSSSWTWQEPWKTAYDAMMSDADTALGSGPFSVTFNGGPNGGHDYHTDPPYTSDGVFDPNADRRDYTQAFHFGGSVRDLGLAYTFTEDPEYADKALGLIRTWCLDQSTIMNPTFTDGQSCIEISISIPGMFYGADLIYNYPGWNNEEKNALLNWAASMAESAKQWNATGNFENWRVNFIASAGALLNDESLLTYAFDRYKAIIDFQINGMGQMVQELGRTNSLSYSLYAMNAMIQTAEIARLRGIDLYNYTYDGSRGLKLALDYYAYYVAHTNEWPYQQMSALNTYEFAFYELAYSYWQEPSYLKIITRARPLNDIYILGPVSLTHANRFELEEISPVLPEDLNNDGIVNMRDIAIVAGLFGTRKGDNNWNSIADLDGNGIVNMRDVSRVAKSYGKTTS